jgi:hypothetical protein
MLRVEMVLVRVRRDKNTGTVDAFRIDPLCTIASSIGGWELLEQHDSPYSRFFVHHRCLQ